MEKKNYGKSVRSRLLNLTNKTGYQYMYILARYFNERLLYRVSVSRYKDNFLLKGGTLLYAMDGLDARPTTDVDFMASNINRDRNYLTKVFRDIIGIVCAIHSTLQTNAQRGAASWHCPSLCVYRGRITSRRLWRLARYRSRSAGRYV